MVNILSGMVLVLSLLLTAQDASAQENQATQLPELSDEQAAWVADRIFANECNRQTSCLTSWNAGEDFPSLGIGHFIWYREGQQERFVESFPDLLGYYVARGVDIPAWISGLDGWNSPWVNREAFNADQSGPRLSELRQFLLDTRGIQAEFIIRRLQQSLPLLSAASTSPDEVSKLFYALANADVPKGMYALIDYVNFKGEGVAVSERYQGEGWGLLQVLENMLLAESDSPLLDQFARSARDVLARRIDNAPPERGEERWRQGWNNRTLTYQQADPE
ncbi:MAG: hypothetical protein Q8S94_05735 [Pseudohongiella sp.]|nr:hypothetical protein [Pseudohongiella sp.]